MKPLQGKQILITRGKSQAKSFSQMIESGGGVARQTPLLTFQLNDSGANRKVLHQLHDYSWVFLTSSNGVKFFFELLQTCNKRIPENLRFAIVGTKTERVLNKYGMKADFVPSLYQASTLGREFFGEHPQPGNILYIRGNRSRDVLLRYFEEKRVFFHSMTVYDTLLVKDDQKKIRDWLNEEKLDALTFTSPSTIQAYISIIKNADQKGLSLPCFCIGPTTAEAAERYGFERVFIPNQYTIESMYEQIVHYFLEEGKR